MSGGGAPEARLRLVARGVVQGVGARPALRRLAERLGLRGRLCNQAGELEADLCGARPGLEAFLAALSEALPAGARVAELSREWLPAPEPLWPPGVQIAAAAAVPLGRALVAPGLAADRAPCARCQAELATPGDRRHRYPFISCCDCGPRFSLATALPFCRAHTTLASFRPCPACAREFSDPLDRRFHSETISCPACGPRLRLLNGAGEPLAEEEAALAGALDRLRGGGVLALQGVGGFQLLVEAHQQRAVERLRERKRRPAKPLALLVHDPAQLEGEVWLSASEERLLRDPAAPIVLLRRRWAGGAERWPGVAPGCAALGVMLPASGLHLLLARGLGRALVATSGNRSGEPLCFQPREAVTRLAGIADAFLVHDLPIARPLDDSLVQAIEERPVLLRRARGYVPEPLAWHGPPAPASTGSAGGGGGALLAVAGDGKAAPALAWKRRVWLLPHLGDLGEAVAAERWQGALEDQLACAAPPVTGLACDAHPGYWSHQRARALAERHGLPLTVVPHHLAHGLAVLGERGGGLPLLVLACDGLGLAAPARPDGEERLWGGELLLVRGVGADGVRWERLAALRPFPLPGGERASREPRRCALGLLAAAGPWALAHPGASRCLAAFTPAERRLLEASIDSAGLAPRTSSLGRLVDGLVSLLGLAQRLSYEGEGGARWQGAAARGAGGGGGAIGGAARRAPARWELPLRPAAGADWPLPLGRWDWQPLLEALLADRAAGGCPERAAWRVERALVEGLVAGVIEAARWSGCRQVALAGGCFQNRSLLEGCGRGLRAGGVRPLWSERVPCHDGGLALGQAWAAQAERAGL